MHRKINLYHSSCNMLVLAFLYLRIMEAPLKPNWDINRSVESIYVSLLLLSIENVASTLPTDLNYQKHQSVLFLHKRQQLGAPFPGAPEKKRHKTISTFLSSVGNWKFFLKHLFKLRWDECQLTLEFLSLLFAIAKVNLDRSLARASAL